MSEDGQIYKTSLNDLVNKKTQQTEGKPRLDLISRIATVKKCEALLDGAKKYGVHDWRKGGSWTTYIAAILRHTLAYLDGETFDKKSGLSHMAHVAANADILLEYEDTHPECDDRYASMVARKAITPGKTMDDTFKDQLDKVYGYRRTALNKKRFYLSTIMDKKKVESMTDTEVDAEYDRWVKFDEL